MYARITSVCLLTLACIYPVDAQDIVDQHLAEVRKQFTVEGQPVNPLAIIDLLPIVSDTLPGPVAIDLDTAVNSDRYFGEVQKHDSLGFLVELGNDADGNDLGWVAYRVLGKLNNGNHVLLVHENGGGTYVSVTLLLVDFVPDTVIGDDGQPIRRALIRNRGMIGLGDRFGGEVKVNGNQIEISADPRSGEPARTIHINNPGNAAD